MIGNIFRWIYCLDLDDVVLLMAAATLAFGILRHYLRQMCWWKPALGLILTGFVAAALYVTVLSRAPGTERELFLIPFHSYRELAAGGNREILRSSFMNVILFYPLGLILSAVLPERWPRWTRVLAALAALTAFSAGLEYAQYALALGRVEIDDVIHNALGAGCGALVSCIRTKPAPDPEKA